VTKILAALWLAAAALPASAQLIGEGNKGSIYDPPKRTPFKKHDHIRIVVVERSKATSQVDLTKDRRSRPEIEFDKFINFEQRGATALPRIFATNLTDDPGIKIDARYRLDNTAKTGRNLDLTFVITAEVIDIRDNGNLVLEAKKTRKINQDIEQIRLTGEVSPQYIVNNAVQSENLVNQQIESAGFKMWRLSLGKEKGFVDVVSYSSDIADCNQQKALWHLCDGTACGREL
jgi:flagellar L-ring protein precursor FlgH